MVMLHQPEEEKKNGTVCSGTARFLSGQGYLDIDYHIIK